MSPYSSAATAMMNRHYDSHEAYVFALAREDEMLSEVMLGDPLYGGPVAVDDDLGARRLERHRVLNDDELARLLRPPPYLLGDLENLLGTAERADDVLNRQAAAGSRASFSLFV